MEAREVNIDRDLGNKEFRSSFPILSTMVNGHALVYLDNAASSQKPSRVLDRIERYYTHEHSNVHRGVHHLSQIATEAYEHSREVMSTFLNASLSREIIFTRGCTDGINLVAFCLSKGYLAEGDEILITEMEHHSNIVPWQMACESTGAKLKVARVHEDGSLDMEDFRSKLSERTRLVSVVHISNALGTINPVKEICRLAHEKEALVLIDGAQSAPHMKVDVQDMACDFYVCSGHKMYGPTGSGVLYGRAEVLESLPPYQGGGEMIKSVSFEKTTYNDIPFRFEAGTPNIEAAIGLAEAARFMQDFGIEKLNQIELSLTQYAHEQLSKIDGIRFIGEATSKTSVVSFVVEGTHPSDIGAIIDKLGIAVRTGHHCTQPLMEKYGVPGTVRASFAAYNTLDEIDLLTGAVQRAVKMLR